jgi:hypothetical protein
MKRLTLAMCAAALVLFACNSETKSDTATGDSTVAKTDTKTSDAPAADPCAGQPAPDPSAMAGMDSTMMAKWMAFATPGEAHKVLADDAGEWDGETTMWMSPDAPPTKNKGKAVNTMILGGRYQHGVHTGCFTGMPFEGISIIGYDNTKKKYVSSWVDNMGTGIMIMEGTYDAASKTVKLSGTCTDPMTGKNMKMREDFTIIDNNTRKMVMYSPDPKTGKEFKSMEIVMTRKN